MDSQRMAMTMETNNDLCGAGHARSLRDMRDGWPFHGVDMDKRRQNIVG